MNFLTLKYFKVAASELNITHAAQKLYISQQALSSHIRDLENELDVQLFTRSPRLALTDAGRCLYEATENFEGITNSLNDQLNDIRNEIRGELRIGLSFTRGQFILPNVLPYYAAEHPQVHVNIYEEHSNQLMDRLIRGEIDFWITAENPVVEGLVKEPLFTEHFFIVVPKSIIGKNCSPIQAEKITEKIRTNLELEDIVKYPFVLLNPGNRSRDLFDNAMRSKKLTPNIMLETDNSQTAFALAQRGMALTVYSDMFLKNYSGILNPDVMIIPLDKYIPSDVLHVYFQEGQLAKYKVNFLKKLHEAYETKEV